MLDENKENFNTIFLIVSFRLVNPIIRVHSRSKRGF